MILAKFWNDFHYIRNFSGRKGENNPYPIHCLLKSANLYREGLEKIA